MPRFAIVLGTVMAAQLCLAGAAMATAGMVCDGLDNDDVFVEMNLPRSPGIVPNWVMISTLGRDFSTKGAEAGVTALSILQSFEDGSSFAVDLSEDMLNPAIKIRLLVAQEGDQPLTYIGYVHVVGQGIYPISCSEDE